MIRITRAQVLLIEEALDRYFYNKKYRIPSLIRTGELVEDILKIVSLKEPSCTNVVPTQNAPQNVRG